MLTALRSRWCAETPTFSDVHLQEDRYDVGLWCPEKQMVKSIQIPSDRLPSALEMIVNSVAGADTYE
jgi:hypothetical protein